VGGVLLRHFRQFLAWCDGRGRVQGSGFRVQGSGLGWEVNKKINHEGSKVREGFRVQGSRFGGEEDV
jgi:hypothetical protein